MHLIVDYRTEYRFTHPQRRVIQLLRVTPANFLGQTIVDWRVTLDCDASVRNHVDGYGNRMTMLYVTGPVELLHLHVCGEVFTEDQAGLIAETLEPFPPTLFLRQTPRTAPSAAILAFADMIGRRSDDPLSRLHQLNRDLNDRIGFNPDRTSVTNDAAGAFAAGHGVCQDFAHIFCATARAMGIPARYVSGHLYRRDGQEQQPAAHAWTEAHVDGLGWVAFDPTNGICTDDAYLRVACGLDYGEAAPLSGARSGAGTESLSVDVTVRMAQRQQQS